MLDYGNLYFKPLKYSPLTDTQRFNFLTQFLKAFSYPFSGISLKWLNMAAPNFYLDVYFLTASFFLRQGNRGKVTGGLDLENRADVLVHRPPVYSETMSHFQPCDWRR